MAAAAEAEADVDSIIISIIIRIDVCNAFLWYEYMLQIHFNFFSIWFYVNTWGVYVKLIVDLCVNRYVLSVSVSVSVSLSGCLRNHQKRRIESR